MKDQFPRVDPDAPLETQPPAYLARRLVEVGKDSVLFSNACAALLGTMQMAAERLDQGRAEEARAVLAEMLDAMGTNHVRH